MVVATEQLQSSLRFASSNHELLHDAVRIGTLAAQSAPLVDFIINIDHYAHHFAFWRGDIAIFNLEPALGGIPQFSQPGLRVSRELFRRNARIPGRFLDHRRLDFIELIVNVIRLAAPGEKDAVDHQRRRRRERGFD